MSGLSKDYVKNLSNISVPKFLRKLILPVKLIVGIFLILFGIIGIILPGLPGWTPLILGVMIISPKHGKMLAKWIYSIYKNYIVKFFKLFSRKDE